jgi:hypothetical protein
LLPAQHKEVPTSMLSRACWLFVAVAPSLRFACPLVSSGQELHDRRHILPDPWPGNLAGSGKLAGTVRGAPPSTPLRRSGFRTIRFCVSRKRIPWDSEHARATFCLALSRWPFSCPFRSVGREAVVEGLAAIQEQARSTEGVREGSRQLPMQRSAKLTRV